MFTAKLDIRYRQSVPPPGITRWVEKDRGRMVVAGGRYSARRRWR
jgi:hypothetical protein